MDIEPTDDIFGVRCQFNVLPLGAWSSSCRQLMYHNVVHNIQ